MTVQTEMGLSGGERRLSMSDMASHANIPKPYMYPKCILALSNNSPPSNKPKSRGPARSVSSIKCSSSFVFRDIGNMTARDLAMM